MSKRQNYADKVFLILVILEIFTDDILEEKTGRIPLEMSKYNFNRDKGALFQQYLKFIEHRSILGMHEGVLVGLKKEITIRIVSLNIEEDNLVTYFITSKAPHS